ncbi:MAG: hypothetical protein IT371_14235 [Deltaproteobacteria bacterium]|nr:hypothetical protein [Deltaproteobacteria bacterium]
MSGPLEAAYDGYLERFQREAGDAQVGGYVKCRGRLIKKLSFEEFCKRWETYHQVRKTYDRILAQGDTVNDALVKILDEHAAELLLKV